MSRQNMESLSQKDFHLLKLSKIVHTCGSNVLNFVTRDLYKIHPLSEEGTLLVEDFCKKISGKSIKKKTGKNLPENYYFNYDEIKAEELSVENKLDISSCCTVIDLCKLENEKFVTDNVLLYETIQSVREIRNQLCHDYCNIDIELIEAHKNDMIKYIQNLCRLMENVLQTNNQSLDPMKYKSLSLNVIKKIKNIWKVKIFAVDKLNECGEIPEGEQILHSLIQKGCAELRKKYENIITANSIAFDDSFPSVSIDRVFVPMAMTVENKQIQYEELLSFNSQKRKTAPPAVVVCGHAGRGKTTLCRKLTSDWCSQADPTLKRYDFLILIEVKRAKEKNLIDYVKNILLPDTLYEKTAEDVLFLLGQINVLFIIDGYDEKSKEASHIIDELLEKLNNKKIVITSRHYSSKDIFLALNRHNIIYLNISIEGFHEKGRAIYINKIWELLLSMQEVTESVNEFITILGSLHTNNINELLKVPLIIVMLIYLFRKGKLKKNFQYITRTAIYDKLFELLVDAVVSKLEMNVGEKKNQAMLTQDAKDLISLFAEESYRLCMSNTYIIDSQMISKIEEKLMEKDLIECNLCILSSFFLCTPSIRRKIKLPSMTGVEAAEYEFFHKTQMEYLVALYCIQSPNYTKERISKLVERNQEELVYNVLPFVVGQLTIHKKLNRELVVFIFEIFKARQVSDPFSLYWNLLSEALYINDAVYEEESYNLALCDALKRTLPPSLWKLDARNVVSGLKLLKVIEMKIESLEIIITEDNDPYAIAEFEKTWKNITFILKNRYKPAAQHARNNNRNSIRDRQKQFLELELHFKSHEIKGDKTSDSFLQNLHPWCTLKKFSGYLGDEGLEAIKGCKSIKHINARFTSIEVFNNFNDICQGKTSLSRVHITLDFDPGKPSANPDSFRSHTIPSLTSVAFIGLKNNNLEWAATVLKNIYNEQCLIKSVYLLKTSLPPKDFHKRFLIKVKDVIGEKFKVQSSVAIGQEEFDKMNKLAIVEWIG